MPLLSLLFRCVPDQLGVTSVEPDGIGDVMEELDLCINILAMKAVQLPLATFRDQIMRQSVSLSANAMVVMYIKKQGDTISQVMCSLAQ